MWTEECHYIQSDLVAMAGFFFLSSFICWLSSVLIGTGLAGFCFEDFCRPKISLRLEGSRGHFRERTGVTNYQFGGLKLKLVIIKIVSEKKTPIGIGATRKYSAPIFFFRHNQSRQPYARCESKANPFIYISP